MSAMALLLVLITAVCCRAQSSWVTDILQNTNAYRKTKGKPALILADDVSTQAQKHTDHMASGKVPMGHDGFQERVQALRSGKIFISGAAENVAHGYHTAQSVVEGWIKSPMHRQNLLGNYTHIGIGVAKAADGSYYFTQLFIKK